jgi:hypothetical protein
LPLTRPALAGVALLFAANRGTVRGTKSGGAWVIDGIDTSVRNRMIKETESFQEALDEAITKPFGGRVG